MPRRCLGEMLMPPPARAREPTPRLHDASPVLFVSNSVWKRSGREERKFLHSWVAHHRGAATTRPLGKPRVGSPTRTAVSRGGQDSAPGKRIGLDFAAATCGSNAEACMHACIAMPQSLHSHRYAAAPVHRVSSPGCLPPLPRRRGFSAPPWSRACSACSKAPHSRAAAAAPAIRRLGPSQRVRNRKASFNFHDAAARPVS